MAGIITVVHGAARQTNSRGLNVAVEAARVGEQGGGLGILATEVPAMAARSIATAREINALIADSATRISDDGVLVAEADLRGG